MPVDLNRLTEGWLELESDPGLFTLLLEDFGVKGVQVEEIYDLQKSIECPVYGFIFLFKWIEERRSRRKLTTTEESCIQDESIVNSIFFAHQVVPNSCATHALLSVLLNCKNIDLGETLRRLKQYTGNMSPEVGQILVSDVTMFLTSKPDISASIQSQYKRYLPGYIKHCSFILVQNKGYAIGNTPELARAHNSHAKPEPLRRNHEKSHGISTGRVVEAFHFISYVPIDGHLFELDGLKPYPIDHGPWEEKEDWTEKFRRFITDRLGIANGGEPNHDIRFNLMAVVPERQIAYQNRLWTLKTNRQIVLQALEQLVKFTHPESRVKEENDDKEKDKGEGNITRDPLFLAPNTTKNSFSPKKSATQGLSPKRMSKSALSDKESPSGATSHNENVLQHYALEGHNYAKSPLMEGMLAPEAVARLRYEDCSGSEYSSDDDGNRLPKTVSSGTYSFLQPMAVAGTSSAERASTRTDPMKPIHVNTTDYSKPLIIQTKFEKSPTPSCSSTDTSSEVGSAFNSPVRTLQMGSAQNSPNYSGLKDFKKFVVIRVTNGKETEENEAAQASPCESSNNLSEARGRKEVRESGSHSEYIAMKRPATSSNDHLVPTSTKATFLLPKRCYIDSISEEQVLPDSTASNDCQSGAVEDSNVFNADNVTESHECSNPKGKLIDQMSSVVHKDTSKYGHFSEPHTFAPKDLLVLLKNIENEITVCESNLRDETEKRRKYTIDDCRRTHNYDQFICSFLSMLESQEILADLVEQHMIIKRRQGYKVGRLHKDNPRKRPRPKRRK